MTSTQWSVYDAGTKRIRYSSVPTSNITAETVMADGFARSQKDTVGIITTATRAYTASGMVLTQTDGRGDTTTTRRYTYNHLGQLTQVTDDAGTRTIDYNTYGEQETESLLAGGVTHLITESRDAMGRSTGFTYVKNGTVQHTFTTGYGTDGRITTASLLHGGGEKQFTYGYLPGSDLLQTLTMPCNMTLTQSYEEKRDLLISQLYKRGTTTVASRDYSYDALGRPITRSTARNGQTVNDSFVHNSRSELVSATVNGSTYGYDYDNIGNRRMSMEVSDYTLHEVNNLNQYTSIHENEDTVFAPTFDADGNQTLVKTPTGIWTVVYNAENRPIRFTKADGSTVIECSYDTHGRRASKKVTTNGSVTLNQRYIYRGYQQIACCDITRSGHPCLWLLTWDPTQPIAPRPLAIRKDGTWYAYGWDLTKNICEVFGPAGYIRTAYTYPPYGNVSSNGDVNQPIRYSSEFFDAELGLTYYNYRYLNSYDGRWISRDQLAENDNLNLYTYTNNAPVCTMDYLGLSTSSGYLAAFLSALPDSVGVISYSSRIAVYPVPVFPIVTVEVYAWVNGNIQQCCNEDDTLGLMLTGFIGMEVNGGVGTSIGGTSNVRAERGKNGSIRYRNGKGGGTGRGGTFSKSPTARNYGYSHKAVRSRSSNGQYYVQLPECNTSINLTFSVGISGFISGGVGGFSAGYQFETTFAKCGTGVPGGCEFTNPITSGSGGIVFGLDSGARIAVFGRGGVDASVQIA